MMRPPKPEVMFERLLRVLKLKETQFVPASPACTVSVLHEETKTFGPKKHRPEVKAHFTNGLSLNIQHLTGDRKPLRIQVQVYTGEGTGCSQILYSCGAAEFAEKVSAIEAGIEAARALGVKVGDL